ncbi:MAG TPA: hypothetical protein VI727_08680 [Candidatus Brocadiaceae bacterium]|nr:hypothetical protein [Candidatus Brocadiaceae bacterium]
MITELFLYNYKLGFTQMGRIHQMNHKIYRYWLPAILAIDIGLLVIGVFGAQLWGLRILALTLASVGLVTFVGVLSTSYELDDNARYSERPMRNAIAASVIVMYLATVGVVSFYPLIEATSGQSQLQLNPMTKAMLDSFHTVVLVVAGFYFATSALAGNRERREKDHQP